MLRFFYLVRLAQQGFLPLIANAYPSLEAEAIIYLADKLVAGSMGGISTIRHELHFSEMMKNEARNMARDIIFKLYCEADEPVADGFKTTYKDVMQIAHCIAGQGIYDYQNNVGAFSSPYIEPSIATVPPVYVVLPHMSMVGDPKLSVPAVDPTLPIPGFLLASKTAHVRPTTAPKDVKEDTASSAWIEPAALVEHSDTVPAKPNGVAATVAPASDEVPVETNGSDAAHEAAAAADPEDETDEATAKDTEKTTKKRRSGSSSKKKSRKSKSDKSKRSESRASQDATPNTTTNATHGEQWEDQTPENDEVNTEPLENNEPQPQEEEEEDNEEDRFADADLSDDEHEILRQDNNDDDDETESKDTIGKAQPQQQQPSTTPTPPSDHTTVVPPPTPSPSLSQWHNFAATCHNDIDGSNSPLSPKSSARSSPKIERRL